jgi:hypothetical protein
LCNLHALATPLEIQLELYIKFKDVRLERDLRLLIQEMVVRAKELSLILIKIYKEAIKTQEAKEEKQGIRLNAFY